MDALHYGYNFVNTQVQYGTNLFLRSQFYEHNIKKLNTFDKSLAGAFLALCILVASIALLKLGRGALGIAGCLVVGGVWGDLAYFSYRSDVDANRKAYSYLQRIGEILCECQVESPVVEEPPVVENSLINDEELMPVEIPEEISRIDQLPGVDDAPLWITRNLNSIMLLKKSQQIEKMLSMYENKWRDHINHLTNQTLTKKMKKIWIEEIKTQMKILNWRAKVPNFFILS